MRTVVLCDGKESYACLTPPPDLPGSRDRECRHGFPFIVDSKEEESTILGYLFHDKRCDTPLVQGRAANRIPGMALLDGPGEGALPPMDTRKWFFK